MGKRGKQRDTMAVKEGLMAGFKGQNVLENIF